MKEAVLKKIKDNILVAVVRGKDDEDAYEISKKIIAGGIKTIEVTFSTPYADNAIEKLSKEYLKDNDVVIGAGTVLDEITARIAILRGAKFIVSPHLNTEISKVCNRYAIPYLPGCGSVTEVLNAIEAGSDVVKLFPGALLGPSYIKDVKGPIPYAKMMPSGGVSIDNIDVWLKNGAYAVGIGSALVKNGHDNISIETKKFVDKIKSLNL
ncbi:bifunctional 2-keto-4-hydroxyglutarate aldolase/2-keto-3-deoxy-6-phosphogluconate aldolase [Caviibacter abscessus]|uniref:bifunctional 2-keto-4-hydroxyglutarate aldolase/2-keto-3-deoxy-6-phosphogluconate aldolase n=1 Tax=Caviibacter abscessus TaxID=1766719 RepID=UPI000834F4FB|nr:bifunctional 2-keto-4-hydroxyglutarate aldolase/2-keto-3-deoxy-6-phosphogluconate aldolase [Caviibacter abscessus]